MFGKGKKSSNDKFVINAGRANGNLKGAGPAFNKKQAMATPGGGEVGKPQGKAPFGKRPISPGKAGPVKMEGD